MATSALEAKDLAIEAKTAAEAATTSAILLADLAQKNAELTAALGAERVARAQMDAQLAKQQHHYEMMEVRQKR